MVTVLWDGTALTDALTGASGDFSLGLTVPDVAAGPYEVGADSLWARASDRFMVEVEAPPTTPPPATTLPPASTVPPTTAAPTTTGPVPTTTSTRPAPPAPTTVATTVAVTEPDPSPAGGDDGAVSAALAAGPATTTTTTTTRPTTTTPPTTTTASAPPPREAVVPSVTSGATTGQVFVRPGSGPPGTPVAITLRLARPEVDDVRLFMEGAPWGGPFHVPGLGFTRHGSVPDLAPGSYPVAVVAGDRVLASTRFTVLGSSPPVPGPVLLGLAGLVGAGVGWWASGALKRWMPLSTGVVDAWYAWWEGRRP